METVQDSVAEKTDNEKGYMETPAYCLVCGDFVVKMEPSEENESQLSDLQYPVDMLQSFLKLFEVNQTWNFDKKQVQFCVACYLQIGQLKQLQKQLEEVERALQEGKKELKGKVEFSESFLQSKLLYQEDGWQRQVRNRILGQKTAHSKQKAVEKKSKGKRKQDEESSRKSVRNVNKPKVNYTDFNEGDPFVLLSTGDKAAAERCKEEVNTKIEQSASEATDEDGEIYIPSIEEQIACSSPSECSELDWEPVKKRAKPNEKSKTKPSPSTKRSKKSKDKGCSSVKDDGIKRKSVKFQKRKGPKTTISISTEHEDKKDPTYVVETDADNNSDEGNSDEDAIKEEYSGIVNRLQTNKNTGALSFFKVTFDKIDDSQYQCQICKENLLRTDIRFHVFREHTQLTTCKECGQKFKLIGQLRAHMKRIHRGIRVQKKKKCDICGKIVWKYLTHRWTHYSEQDKKDAIARGERVPSNFEKKIQCDVCGEKFKLDYQLSSHKMANHTAPENRKRELCPDCGKSVLQLKAHLKLVHGDRFTEGRKFICSICNKAFPTFSRLSMHKVSHNLTHQCTLCPKKFSKEKQLERHMNFHFNIRPFKCDICKDVAFTDMIYLKKHNRCFHEEKSQPKRKSYMKRF